MEIKIQFFVDSFNNFMRQQVENKNKRKRGREITSVRSVKGPSRLTFLASNVNELSQLKKKMFRMQKMDEEGSEAS